MPPSNDLKSQKRVVGLFAYYCKWIKNFLKKIRPLTNNTEFHIAGDVFIAFNLVTCNFENSVVCSIDESLPQQAVA